MNNNYKNNNKNTNQRDDHRYGLSDPQRMLLLLFDVARRHPQNVGNYLETIEGTGGGIQPAEDAVAVVCWLDNGGIQPAEDVVAVV